MGATVSHALSMTSPNDTRFENQPQHWNSAHLITLSAVGSEVSGAFGDGGGVSFGLSADGKITAAAPAGAPSPVNISAGTTSNNLASIVFGNANGISFGLGTGASSRSITGTVVTNYAGVGETVGTIAGTDIAITMDTNGLSLAYPKAITTARASTDAIGLNTAQSNVTWTVNSSGLSFDARGYAGTGTSATNASITLNSNGLAISVGAGGAGGHGLGVSNTGNTLGNTGTNSSGTIVFGASGAITASQSTAAGQSTIWYSVAAQTSQSAIKAFGVSNTGATAGNTGVSTGVDWVMAGSNLLTLSQSTAGGGPNTVWIQHPAWLTTARASTDAVGLNTAKTNVTWTVNSSGISFDAGGYAGTSTGFTGANISGTFTHNTLGLAMSLSVAAPGAAAENNAINLLGNNTAGNTTVTGSTLGFSGLNLTLSGTNNSQLVLSAPATSSLVGANGIGISTNGSTITVSMLPVSYFDNVAIDHHSQTIDPGGSTIWIAPIVLPFPLSASFLRMAKSMSHVSTTFAGTSANTTFSGSRFHTDAVVFYTQMTGASSMSLGSYTSTQGEWTLQTRVGAGTAGSQYTVTFNVTFPRDGSTNSSYSTSYNVSSSNYNISSESMSLFTGWRFNDMPCALSLPPGVYWVGFGESSTSSNNGPAGLVGASLGMSWIGVSQTNTQPGFPGAATNTSVQLQPGLGFWTTNSNVMTKDSIGLNSISAMASNIRPYFQMIRRA